ncbi:Angiotensin-converting enzyme 2 protein [Dioscorea alata]|uniref:Angiotensin-converting enzyme 2 protein n=1 Tax=Dioscorea alata TaxID=55571 RepID=A0ACB7VFY7_DIOAL|nr:Angiotensin-converting enzyme 2 protein [Dioscorea alata]
MLSLIPFLSSSVCHFQAFIMVDSSASYIRMVQHLIERCLLFNMSKEECVEAISQHANINPIITSTVWKELEKENKEFFEEYTRAREESLAETNNTSPV